VLFITLLMFKSADYHLLQTGKQIYENKGIF